MVILLMVVMVTPSVALNGDLLDFINGKPVVNGSPVSNDKW